MKFGRKFAHALATEDWPDYWLTRAIPYKGLKKVLKQIQAELSDIGLDPATLSQLRQDPGSRSSILFQYNFKDQETLVPKLTFYIDFSNGEAINALLTPVTRSYLKAHAQHGSLGNSLDGQGPIQILPSPEEQVYSINILGLGPAGLRSELSGSGQHVPSNIPRAEVPDNTRRVEVPLNFDCKFFKLLQDEIGSLNNLQEKEQKTLNGDIQELSTSLTQVARPVRFRSFQHSDLYRWRKLFALYLQANIFFSTSETDAGARDHAKAKAQLQWFQTELVAMGIESKFRLPESCVALARFVKINMDLLRNLNFQEYNQSAITKILKKFDKKTRFGVAETFSNLVQTDTMIPGNIAKAVCQQVNQSLISIVPQVDDYTCPICGDIHYRTVRLDCRHLLCIRCVIVLQRKVKPWPLCPICRRDTLKGATVDNLDQEMESYLEKFFRKEVRQKQIQNETERGKEDWGIRYKHPSEQTCVVQ